MEAKEIYEQILGISHLKVDRVSVGNRRIDVYCHDDRASQVCPHCDRISEEVKQYNSRQIRDLDMSGKEVWLHVRIRQFHCECGKYFHEQFAWTEPGKSYTKRQSKFIFELCAKQPMKEVGAIVNMCPKTVERLYYSYARAGLALKKRYEQVRKLGIDELAHRKGKGDFCCVLVDLERGIQLDLLPDRKKATLMAHFKGLGAQFCGQIRVVSCDMWGPYSDVARECFPQARIVVDRFHVVKPLNEGLDAARKSLRRKFPKEEKFKQLKWLLFKRPKTCSDKQKQLLDQAFELAPHLEQMYRHRNEFHAIFDQSQDYEKASQWLDQWINQARKIDNNYWDAFLKTLQNWREYILNYVREHVTNAATEGLNNLIRYLKRISFAIPNFEHMRIRVLATNF